MLNQKELYELIKDSYNTSVVADKFCSDYAEIEKIANIASVIHFLRQKLDVAYSIPVISIEVLQ